MSDVLGECLIDAMRPVAADLARTVTARDAAGTAILLQRRSWRELQALAVLLAESSSAEHLKAVCGTCAGCGCHLESAPCAEASRGLCWACYRADLKARRQEAVADPEPDEERQSRKEARMEDLKELLSWGRPLEEAARRVGVTERTATKYLAELRAREAGEPVAA
jgi:hypothetical protein